VSEHPPHSFAEILVDIARSLKAPRPVAPRPATDHMANLGVVVRNLDHLPDYSIAEQLAARPGQAYGEHTAWDFHGRIWYTDGTWYEEVMVYQQHQGIYRAATLEELVERVCARFGRD
jgi:hypothetical protein